ncbi:protein transport protein Sec39, partial [Aspergillus sclerotialis]
DDISWRAVYNAGRYRSASISTSSLQSQIAHLSQRMELLSLALVLVPTPDPLPEILGAWRRCDEEMSILRGRESEEEEAWDTKGDTLSSVPGGFGPSDTEKDAFETKQKHANRAHAHRAYSRHEEAPMGLFEVARGAAAALHKNAFPLHSAVAGAGGDGGPSAEHRTSLDEFSGEGHEGRVRKRDMVSNMVTGGLASGIGWVLGAQPVNR